MGKSHPDLAKFFFVRLLEFFLFTFHSAQTHTHTPTQKFIQILLAENISLVFYLAQEEVVGFGLAR